MNQQVDQDLIRRIRNGDELAKEDLIRKYLPMVRFIVKKHHTPPADFDDYCQEGTIGLLKAITEYDADRYPIKFSTFAYICILRRIYNLIKSTMSRKNRFPNTMLSLNYSFDREDHRTLLDSIAGVDTAEPFAQIDDAWMVQQLDTVLQVYLSPVEYKVIRQILSGYSLGEIQTALSLSMKAVDNARTRARIKLKRILFHYGSLLNPNLPLKTRKRRDLQLDVC